MTDRRSEPDTPIAWLAALSAAVWVTDAQFERAGPRIRYVNAAFERLLGYTADEVVGTTPQIFRHVQAKPDDFEAMRATLEVGGSWHGCMTHTRKDGSALDVAWTVSPVRGTAGRITGYVAIQADAPSAHAPA